MALYCYYPIQIVNTSIYVSHITNYSSQENGFLKVFFDFTIIQAIVFSSWRPSSWELESLQFLSMSFCSFWQRSCPALHLIFTSNPIICSKGMFWTQPLLILLEMALEWCTRWHNHPRPIQFNISKLYTSRILRPLIRPEGTIEHHACIQHLKGEGNPPVK